MNELIKALQNMAKEERESSKKYHKLSLLFRDLEEGYLASLAADMSADEHEHHNNLKLFVKAIKRDYGKRLKKR